MAIAGKVAITPKGEWNANTAYTKLDLVFYNNASYVAIQPSTGVEPTNTSYWMLVVQSAGGADLEAIIDGTQQVGNAKTLDGHGADYFLPKTGGDINGNISQIKTGESDYTTRRIQNPARAVYERVAPNGQYCIFDETNKKYIIDSSADGTTIFNGTASGNLPLSGGTVKTANRRAMNVSNTGGADVSIGYRHGDTLLGEIGVKDSGAYYIDSSNKVNTILHTGNKPTGTYTGNGDATQRTINVGGIGNAVHIHGGGCSVIATPHGAFGINRYSTEIVIIPYTELNFENGKVNMSTTSTVVNTSGVTYAIDLL